MNSTLGLELILHGLSYSVEICLTAAFLEEFQSLWGFQDPPHSSCRMLVVKNNKKYNKIIMSLFVSPNAEICTPKQP